MEWRMDWKVPEPDYDPDRKVTLTIGRLVNALADALAVVDDAPEEQNWKKGDRAFIEVEVQGTRDSDVFFTFANFHSKSHFTLPASLLQEIEE